MKERNDRPCFRAYFTLLILKYIISTLTGTSFILHVKFAAGFEFLDEQLLRKLSPTRYLGLMPCTMGRCSGTSVKKTYEIRIKHQKPTKNRLC